MRSLLWVLSSWPADSSSARLVEESSRLANETYVADVRTLEVARDGIHLVTRRLRTPRPMTLGAGKRMPLTAFTAVCLRPSPPFDLAHVHALRMLAGQARNITLNPPEILLRWTSKTILLELAGREAPESIVTADASALHRFVRRRAAFVKQLHRAEGRGVERVERGDPLGLIRKHSSGFRSPVLLQQAVDSDEHTRVWMVDGEPIAAADTADHRNVRPRVLTGKIGRVAERVGDHLHRLGVRLAGVDFVGDMAIEANICRPGLIVEYERAAGVNLAKEIASTLLCDEKP